MKIPISYTFRNFRSRKLTTGITITGIALVVFVFTAVLMMAYGIQRTLKATGQPNNVLVSRKAATGEISSIIPGDVVNIIKTLPQIARNADNKPLLSAEPVVIINLEITTGGVSNISVRGVGEQVFALRPQVKLVNGRMFNFGSQELIVGESVAKKFPSARIGEKLKIAGAYWTVVGTFTTDGSGFDSEVWGDALQLLSAFNRGSSVSTLTFRLANPSDFSALKEVFSSDRRLLQFEPKIEQQYFEEQSEVMAKFITILGTAITVIFSFGAIIGAMITMYAAVANRTVEIGTLRALGFRRRSILTAFMTESLLIALIGWGAGTLLSLFLASQKISTLNFGSFSEIEFGFSLSGSILISSLIFAVAMGILGGFLPSVRAARQNIVNALRAG